MSVGAFFGLCFFLRSFWRQSISIASFGSFFL